MSRLTKGYVYDGPTGAGVQRYQHYTYDAFGNLTNIQADVAIYGRSTPTNPATNRLTGGGYDDAGNVAAWNGNAYEYDGAGMMSRNLSGSEDWRYVYTADDERFWAYRVGGSGSVWTLRGLDGKVLREYDAHVSWSTFRDYVYRDGQLLASVNPGEGQRQFHLDHLGTPRAVTNSAGTRVAYHAYFPFGEELTGTSQDVEQMKFTGHERDRLNTAGVGDDLDYMHARHYGPLVGRFLSFDPVGGNPQAPQTWNRYAYVLGNPLKYTDPFGLFACQDRVCTDSIDAGFPNDSSDPRGFFGFLSFGAWLRGSHGFTPSRSPGFDLRGHAYYLGQSFAAFGDGLILFGDPFAAYDLYDPQEFGIAHFTGELTPAIAAAIPSAGGSLEAMAATGAGRTLSTAKASDFVRTGKTIVSNQLITGPGSKGATVTWAVKGGGVNRQTGFGLPFHYHIHRYNWYRPWTWFQRTPIIR